MRMHVDVGSHGHSMLDKAKLYYNIMCCFHAATTTSVFKTAPNLPKIVSIQQCSGNTDVL